MCFWFFFQNIDNNVTDAILEVSNDLDDLDMLTMVFTQPDRIIDSLSSLSDTPNTTVNLTQVPNNNSNDNSNNTRVQPLRQCVKNKNSLSAKSTPIFTSDESSSGDYSSTDSQKDSEFVLDPLIDHLSSSSSSDRPPTPKKPKRKSLSNRANKKNSSTTKMTSGYLTDDEFDFSQYFENEKLLKAHRVPYVRKNKSMTNNKVEYLTLMKKEDVSDRVYVKLQWPKDPALPKKDGWHAVHKFEKGAVVVHQAYKPKITMDNTFISIANPEVLLDIIVLTSYQDQKRRNCIVFNDSTLEERTVEVQVIKKYAQTKPFHYEIVLVYEHKPGEYFVYFPPCKSSFCTFVKETHDSVTREYVKYRCQSYKHNKSVKCMASILIPNELYESGDLQKMNGKKIQALIRIGAHVNECCISSKFAIKDLNRDINDKLISDDPILYKRLVTHKYHKLHSNED